MPQSLHEIKPAYFYFHLPKVVSMSTKDYLWQQIDIGIIYHNIQWYKQCAFIYLR